MSFDRIAPHYRWLEGVLAGPHLHACRRAFLSEMSQAESILLLGEGHGRFLAELLKQPAHDREIVVVDSSAGMLRAAQRAMSAVTSPGRIQFLQADVRELRLSRRFDAVVTHFFLDCFTADQLARLIPTIGSWIIPGGSWQVADFQVPKRWLPACRARLVLALAYRFFGVFTGLPARRLVPPQRLLAAIGLSRRQRHEFNFGLLYSELWRATEKLPATGRGLLPSGHETADFAHASALPGSPAGG